MPIKRIQRIKPAAEHGGACPTCGHCKCCEKAARPMVQIPAVCTRRHYPETWDWTYRPWWSPQITTTGSPQITSTVYGICDSGNLPTIPAEAKQ